MTAAHARYKHLNFFALKKLHKEEMVHGLSAIKCVNKLSDGCLTGKHSYRAVSHWSSCTTISAGPSSRRPQETLFLLVDDKSRAFKHEQRQNAGKRCGCCARTEAENSPRRALVSTATSSVCSDTIVALRRKTISSHRKGFHLPIVEKQQSVEIPTLKQPSYITERTVCSYNYER